MSSFACEAAPNARTLERVNDTLRILIDAGKRGGVQKVTESLPSLVAGPTRRRSRRFPSASETRTDLKTGPTHSLRSQESEVEKGLMVAMRRLLE